MNRTRWRVARSGISSADVPVCGIVVKIDSRRSPQTKSIDLARWKNCDRKPVDKKIGHVERWIMRRLLAGPRSALASSPSAEGTCRRQVSALHRVANELQLPNELWRRDEPSRCRAAWWRCPWCNSRFWRPWAPGIEWRCGLGWPALLATCAAAWVRRQWLDPLRLDQIGRAHV